jgi:hypothetical protein
MQPLKIEAKLDVPELGLKKGDTLTAFEAYLNEVVPGKLTYSYFLIYIPKEEKFVWAGTEMFKHCPEILMTFPKKP